MVLIIEFYILRRFYFTKKIKFFYLNIVIEILRYLSFYVSILFNVSNIIYNHVIQNI